MSIQETNASALCTAAFALLVIVVVVAVFRSLRNHAQQADITAFSLFASYVAATSVMGVVVWWLIYTAWMPLESETHSVADTPFVIHLLYATVIVFVIGFALIVGAESFKNRHAIRYREYGWNVLCLRRRTRRRAKCHKFV